MASVALPDKPITVRRAVNVLIVEDDSSQCRTLGDILEAEGFGVRNCDTLQEARLLIRSGEFSVIILDRRLPDGDGVELLEFLSEENHTARTIMYTGYSSFESARDAVNYGAFAYVEKAGDPDELLRHVHRAANVDLADQLQAEEQLTDAILSTSIAAITLVDKDGNITIANDRAKDVLGLEADVITQRKYNDPTWRHTDFEGNPFPEHHMPFYRVRQTEKSVFDVQHAIEWPDGKRRYLSINGAPLFTAAGDFNGAVFCVIDITDNVTTEQVLRQSQAELEERVAQRTEEISRTNERLREEIHEREIAEDKLRQRQTELAHAGRLTTMGQMASGLAHELNQPLTAIRNYARGILKRMEAKEPTSIEMLNAMVQVVQQTERASSIIQHMRQMVKKREHRRTEVEINGLIQDVLELIAHDAKLHSVQLQTDFHEPSPYIDCDVIEIEQVILNLIRNAIDACVEEGAENKLVSIETKKSENRVIVNVKDCGKGLTDIEAERVFEPFYTTKAEGMGMGLAISQAIIESHCGKISAASNADGSGSTFSVALPIK